MGTISLVTPVPGPKSQALMRRREAAVPRGPFHVAPVFVESAEGASVTDVDGNVLLDFTAGLGTLNAGHANPRVVDAVVAQARRFLHTCFHIAPYEPYVALAEQLNRVTPGRFPKKTLLVNSGAEAVENAVKIARHHTGRPAVVGFEHGFAGRTLLALSLTSKVTPYKHGFGPFVPEVYRLPYPYLYRSGFSDEEAFVDHAIEQLHAFFAAHVAPDQVACVVMELVLGEGGFVVAPRRYVRALCDLCREHGILFVADEIQTGFARTGRMFAAEHYGIEPDLVTLAKSLGGGTPISAVTGRAEVMDSVQVGGLGGTYGGNPLACAAAIATLEQVEALGLPARAEAIGARLRRRLEALGRRDGRVGEVRGLGAMMAVELVEDRGTRAPARALTAEVVRRCVEAGVIVISAGTFGNVLRFLVPLVISDEELDEGLAVVEQALTPARGFE
jgi:4-aminobutyrate aminotransferase/(S)-3-amino-2-methylpropionate transaminase